MGGDFGPAEIVPATVNQINQNQQLQVILVGKRAQIEAEIAKHKTPNMERIMIHHTDEEVNMDESAVSALRNKKQSSMRIALELVETGQARGCVSAGNTGALMVISRYILKMFPDIDRPALCTTLPGLAGDSHLLDMGANIDSSSAQLFQFALMGSVLSSVLEDIPKPKVALLNIGSEDMKGNDTIKQAAKLLADSHLNYIGFVEGTDIYSGQIDVIVCDGFMGNIAIKTSEGVAAFLKYVLRSAYRKNWYSRFAALLSKPVLNSLKNEIDPRKYNGASFLGLKGIVLKSHGNADRISFQTAIKKAMLEVEGNVVQKIGDILG